MQTSIRVSSVHTAPAASAGDQRGMSRVTTLRPASRGLVCEQGRLARKSGLFVNSLAPAPTGLNRADPVCSHQKHKARIIFWAAAFVLQSEEARYPKRDHQKITGQNLGRFSEISPRSTIYRLERIRSPTTLLMSWASGPGRLRLLLRGLLQEGTPHTPSPGHSLESQRPHGSDFQLPAPACLAPEPTVPTGQAPKPLGV